MLSKMFAFRSIHGFICPLSISQRTFEPSPRSDDQVVRHAQVLVHDRDFPLRWGQARENHKADRFLHAVAVPAALLDFDDAYKRVGWVDQI